MLNNLWKSEIYIQYNTNVKVILLYECIYKRQVRVNRPKIISNKSLTDTQGKKKAAWKFDAGNKDGTTIQFKKEKKTYQREPWKRILGCEKRGRPKETGIRTVLKDDK